ncbi:MAG: AAA family ATPase [Lachnospiraceae bacterium]|nr:AAA family ATPase [Lachnospiraceae bacterium]
MKEFNENHDDEVFELEDGESPEDDEIWEDDEDDEEILGDEIDPDDVVDMDGNALRHSPIPFYYPNFRPPAKDIPFKEFIFSTPKRIYTVLDKKVYGHDAYKRALSVFIWKAYHGHRPGTMLIVGQSGSGKTEMIRALKESYRNIAIADGASLTPAGYKDESKLATYLRCLDFSDRALPPLFVIDEFDKMILRQQGGWSGTGLVFELLKFLEGGNVNIGEALKPTFVDTSKVCFLLLGAFSNLAAENRKEKSFGFSSMDTTEQPAKRLEKKAILDMIPPELCGRIEETIILDPFTEDDYRKILKDRYYSPISRLGKELHIDVKISDDRADQIAHNAFVNGTGVRSMNSEISSYINNRLFEDPEIKTIYIT